jgi:SAM-dependent methyltransferase
MAGVRPRNVLEVGCANGVRLAALRDRHGCRVVGVEPSSEARLDGNRRFPGIELHRGRADAVPVAGPFELVIVSFVFHWVDRAVLLRSVGEIDRLVADGGYLAIGDFDPPFPHRTPYHHLPEGVVWTYKQNYATLFDASHLYRTVLSFSAGTDAHVPSPTAPPDQRVAYRLLAKSYDDGYPIRRWAAEGGSAAKDEET